MKKKKGSGVIPMIFLIVVLVIAGLYIRNIKLRRAEYLGNAFKFDNKIYEEISYTEIYPYDETWKVVCKTTDGAWTIYEIEQYPEQEYLVARTSWEARVLKRVK